MSIIKLALAGCLALGALRAAETSMFEFHSNFWVNLHHYLYEQALAKEPAAEPWKAAVEYYRRDMTKHDLLEDSMGAINWKLSHLGATDSLKNSGLPPELIAVLEDSAPAYRTRLWPEHDRANQAWIAAVKPLLQKYEEPIAKDLTAVYQEPWRKERIRVDVAEYASWAGAYTNVNPGVHITITSTDPTYKGQASLEMLFHEASHAQIDKVSNAMDAAMKAQNKLYKRRAFWHAVLFYSAGKVTERHLDGYTQFGVKHDVLERGWPGSVAVLDKDWLPYIDGKIDLATAIQRVIDDYSVPRK